MTFWPFFAKSKKALPHEFPHCKLHQCIELRFNNRMLKTASRNSNYYRFYDSFNLAIFRCRTPFFSFFFFSRTSMYRHSSATNGPRLLKFSVHLPYWITPGYFLTYCYRVSGCRPAPKKIISRQPMDLGF